MRNMVEVITFSSITKLMHKAKRWGIVMEFIDDNEDRCALVGRGHKIPIYQDTALSEIHRMLIEDIKKKGGFPYEERNTLLKDYWESLDYLEEK